MGAMGLNRYPTEMVTSPPLTRVAALGETHISCWQTPAMHVESQTAVGEVQVALKQEEQVLGPGSRRTVGEASQATACTMKSSPTGVSSVPQLKCDTQWLIAMSAPVRAELTTAWL